MIFFLKNNVRGMGKQVFSAKKKKAQLQAKKLQKSIEGGAGGAGLSGKHQGKPRKEAIGGPPLFFYLLSSSSIHLILNDNK